MGAGAGEGGGALNQLLKVVGACINHDFFSESTFVATPERGRDEQILFNF